MPVCLRERRHTHTNTRTPTHTHTQMQLLLLSFLVTNHSRITGLADTVADAAAGSVIIKIMMWHKKEGSATLPQSIRVRVSLWVCGCVCVCVLLCVCGCVCCHKSFIDCKRRHRRQRWQRPRWAVAAGKRGRERKSGGERGSAHGEWVRQWHTAAAASSAGGWSCLLCQNSNWNRYKCIGLCRQGSARRCCSFRDTLHCGGVYRAMGMRYELLRVNQMLPVTFKLSS